MKNLFFQILISNKRNLKLNQIETDNFFCFPDGFRSDKLNIFIRMMLKIIKKVHSDLLTDP